MKPAIHAVTSFSLGLVIWFFTKSLYAGALCFASGFLIDVDHIIEYVLQFGFSDLRFKKVYHTCEEVLFKKLYLIFHSFEAVILLWLATALTKNVYLLGAAVGYSSHMIMDVMANRLSILSYFIMYRLRRRFELGRLANKDHPYWTKNN